MPHTIIPRGSAVSDRRQMAPLAGSFELNGASAPTVWGGDIIAVQRLLTGAAPFFRVTMTDTARYHDALSAPTATAYLDEAAKALFACPHVGAVVADSGPAINTATQIDILVKDAAGALIDSAGIRINLGGSTTI